MIRKLNLLLVCLLMTVAYGFSQSGLGTIRGSVIDAKSKEPVYGCRVVLKQNGTIKAGVSTDFDGLFQVNSLSPGSYDVEIRNEGEDYQPYLTTGVIVNADRITFLDNTPLSKRGKESDLEVVEVVAYRVPLINKDGGASGATVTREDIARLPVRSATGVAGTVGGVNVQEGTDDISVRGSRSDGTYFYIDGIKVRGSSNLPKSAIEEVSVITGGLPANYGDVTGGIISVTTRGPSSKYFGSIEGVTSGFYFKGKDPDGYDGKVFGLDKYGYNLVEGMVSGPLWMQKDSTGKKTKPRLGFLLSVNYTDELDGRPLGNGGNYRIKKEARDYLLANPLRPDNSGTGAYSNAEFLRESDFERVKWRMNARRSTVSASGKIDVNTGPSMNLSFGGSLNYSRGRDYNYSNSLLNFTNFGDYNQLDWRVYGRLSQRFVNNTEGTSSKIKSAYYTLMVDYSKSQTEYYDARHKFDLFGYGYVGKFVTTRENNYEFNSDTRTNVHTGFRDVRVDFTPSETNSALAAFTTQYYDIYRDEPLGHFDNLNQIRLGNGLVNGDLPRNIYNIWSNLGSPYNGFGKTENDQFRISGSGSVNIGGHAITLGFEFEQRFDRGWRNGTTVNGGANGPVGLWTFARQRANYHITELDPTKSTIEDFGDHTQVTYERMNSGYAASHNGQYGGDKNDDEQSFFDYNLRKKLGLNGGDATFIDIDAYDPSMYSLDMFSADELLNSGNTYVSYWGFDHTGKKVKGTTDINSYFNDFDENGNYKRFVGSFQPIYASVYAMDKFAFKDIVFNVGVRMDVFDANQPVLKDPYLLFNAYTAGEARAREGQIDYEWIKVPESIGNDYTVYVNDVNTPTKINGFRSGDKWFNADGIEIEDPKLLRGAAGIAPWLIDPSQKRVNASAFTKYKPQFNIMPRIAFSFPISDEASFFAHYDILTKRPTTGIRFDPVNYQFIETRSTIISNPNLKPETTIDYELGFQQVLSRTSSLKISAFYREQRNNVQLVNMFEAYPNSYKTYGNRDFGTVKGVTIAYDMRRTGNVRMTAAYTLQFAEGTGSDATSAQGLINAGLPNLRNIFPYNFDQRHAFAITFDYRYGSGADYNGPMIGNAKILENTGLNIVSNIYSGSPYSSQAYITDEASFSPQSAGLTGTLNGSRTPWAYRLDLQLDRSFDIEVGKQDKKKVTYLNVYLRVTNLLNQMNILNVYRATGNWNDDGYLAAATSQQSIQNQLDEQSYRDYYTMKIQNAYNISSPRTIRLGVKFDF